MGIGKRILATYQTFKVSPSISIGFMVNYNISSEQSNTGRNNRCETLQKRFGFLTSEDMSLKTLSA